MARAEAALVVLSMSACAQTAAIEPAPPRWTGDVESIVTAKCASCHSTGNTEPDLSSYPKLFECRADGTPIARPGDRASPLLAVLDRSDHAELLGESDRTRLEAWVVAGALEYAGHLAHPPGYAARGSDAFHGIKLAAERFSPLFDKNDPGACGRCHDAPVDSGAPACTSCHRQEFTSTSCDGCHGRSGDPLPRADSCASSVARASAALHGLHAEPAAGAPFEQIACATCHTVPSIVTTPGHLDSGGRASVQFDPARLPGASYDAASRTCAASQCHLDLSPSWTASATISPQCNDCHGNPPLTSSHKSGRACAVCHKDSYGPDQRLLASKHIDGLVEVGHACGDCHSAGPAPSAGGDPGAHAAHLIDGRFREKLTCDVCHVVPGGSLAPGHMDQARAPVSLNGDAATERGRLSPAFDPTSKRCTNTGCHGALLDHGQRETPPWTGTSSTAAIACGGCHGLPPVEVRGGAGIHLPTGSADCGACHRDAAGQPITIFTATITEAGKRSHMNGCVDLYMGCAP